MIPLSEELERNKHHPLTRAGNATVSFRSSVLNFLVILSGYELPLNVKKIVLEKIAIAQHNNNAALRNAQSIIFLFCHRP